MTATEQPSPISTKHICLYLVCLSLLTFAFHSAGGLSVIFPSPGHVRMLDTDSYFHVRHSRYTMHHFPHLLRDDVAAWYPGGTRSDGNGLFDVAIAASTLLITGGRPDDQMLEYAAAWLPVILGVLAVLLQFALVWWTFPRWVAFWASLVLLVYPGFFLPRTSLGFADHHAAEIALSLAVALGLCFAMDTTHTTGWKPKLARAFIGALPLTVFLFTWLGAALFVAMAALALLFMIVADAYRGDDLERTVHGALLYGGFVLLQSLAVAVCIPESMMDIDAFKMGWMACIWIIVIPVILSRVAKKMRARGDGATRIALTLMLIGVASALLPLMVTARGRVRVAYLLRTKTTLITEHVVITQLSYVRMLAIPGLLAFLGLPLVFCRAATSDRFRLALVPCAIGSAISALWLLTRDYGYQAPPFIALLAGATLATVASTLDTRLPALFRPRIAVALLLSIVFLPLPFIKFATPYVTEASELSLREIDPGWEEAMDWMRTNTPASGIPPQSSAALPPPDSYGVFCIWDRGNFINTLADRWPVFSRYPTSELARWFSITDEKESLPLLCPWCKGNEKVRYIVLDARTISDKFMSMVTYAEQSMDTYDASAEPVRVRDRVIAKANYGPLYRRAISSRLYYTDGSGLGYYRVVFESMDKTRHFFVATDSLVARRSIPVEQAKIRGMVWSPNQTVLLPDGIVHDVSDHASVKIFERVPGALLTGKTVPGSVAVVELLLRIGQKSRQYKWNARVKADDKGVFTVRVPYATTPPFASTAVRADAKYHIVCANPDKPLSANFEFAAVTEEQIQAGATVEIPSIKSSPSQPKDPIFPRRPDAILK